jgi:hypothetical protein
MIGRWPEAALAIALVAAWPLLCRYVPLTHDIAWQLWLGRQMSHGVGLYSPLLEVNPPLWFWAAVPIVRASAQLGISALSGLIGAFVLATAISAGLLAVLTREEPAGRRFSMYLVLSMAAVVLLMREFGQREQYVLLASVPYVAMIARRAEGRTVSTPLALGVALFAASGFALKPYFVAAPLFLEAWLWVSARRNWRPWRPEWFVLPIAAVAYGAAVLAFTPDYLTSTVPMDRVAYGAYQLSIGDLLGSEQAWPAALAALGVALLGRIRSRIAAACLVAAAAYALAYAVQAKGWFYQGIPAMGFILLGVAAEAGVLRWSELNLRQKFGAGFLVCAFVIPFFVAALLGVGVYHNRFRPDVLALTRDLKPGQPVLAFSARSSFAWPMVEERGLVWISRDYTFWMLPAIARARASGHPGAEIERLAKTVQAQALQDMRCHPPVRIWVHDPKREARDRALFGNAGFDYLAFFREDPGIAELLTHYRPGSAGPWRTFDLVDPTGIRPEGPCRPIF